MKRRGEYAMLTRRINHRIVLGKWTHDTRIDEVRVLARADHYAMVRFKGSMPFVVSERDLIPV